MGLWEAGGACPLPLWATAPSPASSDPGVTPSPSWAAADSRTGWVERAERGRGVAGALSPVFALGSVTAEGRVAPGELWAPSCTRGAALFLVLPNSRSPRAGGWLL